MIIRTNKTLSQTETRLRDCRKKNTLETSVSRGPKDHINLRILRSGSKAKDKQDSRNHGLQDP